MRLKALVYIAFMILILSYQLFTSNGLLTGKATTIKQLTLDGDTANNYLSTGPAIIYFWAEWCGICDLMQEPISGVLNDYPVLSIALKSGSDVEVKEYLNNQMLNWKVVNDPLGVVSQQYQVTSVPSIFFLNENGKIKLTTVGYTSELGLRIRMWLLDKMQ